MRPVMKAMLAKRLPEVAARLRGERERIGCSRRAFAREIGVSRETLRLWERGRCFPKMEALLNAMPLGVDIVFVLTGAAAPALREKSTL